LSFRALYLLFPLVLTLHNLDEFRDSRSRSPPPIPLRWLPRHSQREVMRLAMILLTLASVGVAVCNYLGRDSIAMVAELSVFALLFNAVVHLSISLRARSFTPGTRSALILVLPYCVVTIVALHQDAGRSAEALLPLALAGLIALPLTIILTLAVSLGLYQLIARR
jgi:hypothetical protein